MKKLIVIVPAFNEEERVASAIEALNSLKEFYKTKEIEFLVYIINDGSTDKTLEIAKNSNADRIIKHKINLGLGAAIRSGLTAAKHDNADIVVKFDADLQHNPDNIWDLIQPILNDEADTVYGHRFNKIAYKMPFVRKIGNKVFSGLMRWLTSWPVYDSQPGILAVNSAYLKNFYIPGDYNYTQQILLNSYHSGMRFAHVDVEFRKRETGKSFISYKYPFKVIPQIMQIVIGIKPLKFFAPIGLLFLGIAALIGGVEILMWLSGNNPKPIEHVNLVLGSFLFGVQTLFFGLLADLIVKMNRRDA
jgi:glycosyltransferase involved in cell wall biosynthesis